MWRRVEVGAWGLNLGGCEWRLEGWVVAWLVGGLNYARGWRVIGAVTAELCTCMFLLYAGC